MYWHSSNTNILSSNNSYFQNFAWKVTKVVFLLTSEEDLFTWKAAGSLPRQSERLKIIHYSLE